MNLCGANLAVLFSVTMLCVSCARQQNDPSAPKFPVGRAVDQGDKDTAALTRSKADVLTNPDSGKSQKSMDASRSESSKGSLVERLARTGRSAPYGSDPATGPYENPGTAPHRDDDGVASDLSKRSERNAKVRSEWWSSNEYQGAPLGRLAVNSAEMYGGKRGAAKPFEGFLGMRGRKWSNDEGKRRIPDGFLGMRGKKWQPIGGATYWDPESEPLESRQYPDWAA